MQLFFDTRAYLDTSLVNKSSAYPVGTDDYYLVFLLRFLHSEHIDEADITFWSANYSASLKRLLNVVETLPTPDDDCYRSCPLLVDPLRDMFNAMLS